MLSSSFWVHADEEAAPCKEALAQFNKIVSGLGDLIKAVQVQVSDASAAEAAKYSVDTAALSTDPCKLEIVLLPFDEDKGEPEEWQHFSGLPSVGRRRPVCRRMHHSNVMFPYSNTQFLETLPCLSNLEMLSQHVTDLTCAAAGEINGRELQKFALEAFPSFVTRVTDSTMQQFMSPDMGTPRVFLFTDKDETPAVYAALSVNLRRYKYKFADVHKSDAALMQQFNVKKVGRTRLGLHTPVPRMEANPSDIVRLLCTIAPSRCLS